MTSKEKQREYHEKFRNKFTDEEWKIRCREISRRYYEKHIKSDWPTGKHKTPLVGEKNPMYGKVRTLEEKTKMSINRKGKGSGKECMYRKNNIPKYDLYVGRLEPFEECRRNIRDANILEVKCTYCGKWFIPPIVHVDCRMKGIEKNDRYRFYCSISCQSQCPIFGRKMYYKGQEGLGSREVQPELRKLVFERDEHRCQKCGVNCYLECHHIDTVKNNPIESADIDNCITLCKGCHGMVHSNIKECNNSYLANCAGVI